MGYYFSTSVSYSNFASSFYALENEIFTLSKEFSVEFRLSKEGADLFF